STPRWVTPGYIMPTPTLPLTAQFPRLRRRLLPELALGLVSVLEVSDIYLNNRQAKFLNSPNERRFSFSGSLAEPALPLFDKLNEKLAKTSYRKIYKERGAGILLLTCQELLFRQSEPSTSA